MATYKVIQDIEAEDHILGPLSLRQFIYGLIAAFCLYLCFICLTKHAAFLLILFLPPAIFAGFFAFPFGKDQPTEVAALAKLRFLFKPRLRIWNQSGVKELVTITVPKKLDIQLTNGLNQTEVKSRLEALANTIDSRGWAIKNAGAGGYTQQAVFGGGGDDSDRLINIGNMPQPVPDYDVPASEDMLDEQASPIAQQFTQMINNSTQNHRQQLLAQLSAPPGTPLKPASAKWFVHPPLGSPHLPSAITPASSPVVAASEPSPADTALAAEARQHLAAGNQANARLHTLKPKAAAAPDSAPKPSPAAPDAAILNLANNNDHSVATLAREAGKVQDLDGSEGEVVISLH